MGWMPMVGEISLKQRTTVCCIRPTIFRGRIPATSQLSDMCFISLTPLLMAVISSLGNPKKAALAVSQLMLLFTQSIPNRFTTGSSRFMTRMPS